MICDWIRLIMDSEEEEIRSRRDYLQRLVDYEAGYDLKFVRNLLALWTIYEESDMFVLNNIRREAESSDWRSLDYTENTIRYDFELGKDIIFVNSMTRLNYLNELDRSLLVVYDLGSLKIYIMFAVRRSVGIERLVLDYIKTLWTKNLFKEAAQAALRYGFYAHGNVDDPLIYVEMIGVVEEFFAICNEIFVKFMRREEKLEKRSRWEPKVQRIEPGINAEMFVLILLKEVFYIGYRAYYFDEKCKEIIKLEDGNELDVKQSYKIGKVFYK
jgi:hypothetical protein